MNNIALRFTDADAENPIVHPAFGCYDDMVAPDLYWHLARSVNFPSIVNNNIIPLYLEEYDTYLTHPPIKKIEIRFDAMPTFSYDVNATGGFGITLRDFMERVAYHLRGFFNVDEWNNKLSQNQREQVLIGYHMRTRRAVDETKLQDIKYHPPERDTPYKVSDMLGEEFMFFGMAMEEGDPAEWTIYTCREEQCRIRPVKINI